MKLRHPMLIKAAAFGAAGVLSAWFATLRFRMHPIVPNILPGTPGLTERFIYTFWHETLLIPAMAYRHHDLKILISQHADGELIAQVCRHLGIRSVRGSPSRGGAVALRKMIAMSERSHLAITPDGPRGPRRVAQRGAVYLAGETGRALVPAGFAFHHCWRAPSWDRFAVGYPLSPCVGVLGAPIRVPRGLGRGGLEDYRVRLEEAMLDLARRAEERAARETW